MCWCHDLRLSNFPRHRELISVVSKLSSLRHCEASSLSESQWLNTMGNSRAGVGRVGACSNLHRNKAFPGSRDWAQRSLTWESLEQRQERREKVGENLNVKYRKGKEENWPEEKQEGQVYTKNLLWLLFTVVLVTPWCSQSPLNYMLLLRTYF